MPNEFGVRNAFERIRVQKDFEGESRTKQSMRDQVNINTIVAKYAKTGVVEHLAKKIPTFGDFSNSVDYQTDLERIQQAHEDFMELPAEVRAWAENDPGVLLDKVNDPDNIAEMNELGLEALAASIHGAPGPQGAAPTEGESAAEQSGAPAEAPAN